MGEYHDEDGRSGGGWTLRLEATVLVGLVKLCLRLLPFGATRRLLASVPARRREGESDRPSAEMLVRSVESASERVPGRTSCLVEAMSAQALFDRHGYSTTVRLGLSRPDGRLLHAHAWVEHRGEVVLGDCETLSGFSRLPPLRRDA